MYFEYKTSKKNQTFEEIWEANLGNIMTLILVDPPMKSLKRHLSTPTLIFANYTARSCKLTSFQTIFS